MLVYNKLKSWFYAFLHFLSFHFLVCMKNLHWRYILVAFIHPYNLYFTRSLTRCLSNWETHLKRSHTYTVKHLLFPLCTQTIYFIFENCVLSRWKLIFMESNQIQSLFCTYNPRHHHHHQRVYILCLTVTLTVT